MTGYIENKKARSLIFINIVICSIASSLLSTAMSTMLSTICYDFDISLTTGQWMTSGYTLVMAIMTPLTAFLITRYKVRNLYIASISLFIAGLLISATAPNFFIMMIGRILQASASGILISLAQVITLSIFPPEKKGAAMGWYGLAVGAAPVVAPTIAGFFVDYLNWRTFFLLVLIIMAAALIYSILVMQNCLETTDPKFDTASFALSALAFGGLTLGIGNLGNYPIISIEVGLSLLIGIVSLALFIKRQLSQSEPFLELRLFKSKDFSTCVIVSFFLYFAMMGSAVLLPLYVQRVMGMSTTISGLVTLPGALIMAIISPFAGRIYDKAGIKMLLIIGGLCLALSNFAMCFVSTDTSLVLVAVINVFRYLAIGCLLMPIITWGIGKMNGTNTAHATALLTSLRSLGGSIGSAVFVTIMTLAAGGSIEGAGGITGVHTAYLVIGLVTLIVFIAGIFVKQDRKNIRTEEAAQT